MRIVNQRGAVGGVEKELAVVQVEGQTLVYFSPAGATQVKLSGPHFVAAPGTHYGQLVGNVDALRNAFSEFVSPDFAGREELQTLRTEYDRLKARQITHATPVADTPSTADAALFDALAEYDRLVAVESDLKHRADAFRPEYPEAEEANAAHTAACDKSMAAWERVRAIPAATQAGLLARIQATDRYMADLGEETIYEEDWSVIKNDAQRIAGEAGS